MFARSTDGGVTWSEPLRLNHNPDGYVNWQWFGTMSVAPNGRIDVIWNDTGYTQTVNLSELYYAGSYDGGLTWSEGIPVSPVFDSHVGWPQQNKIGDYYDMVSDLRGVSIAYSATFNGEQDVYFLRIGADCNGNGITDEREVADGDADDCNDNLIPDECDLAEGRSEDCSGNGIPDECDADSDGDGLIDLCDNCPGAANADQADYDGDGKGDRCDPCPLDSLDDRDGDGACDSDDGCPEDPDKQHPGECGCGVADEDDDGDGVPECNDKCPGVSDAVFGPECEQAIPTISEWGLVVLALLLLSAGKIYFHRQRPPAAA